MKTKFALFGLLLVMAVGLTSMDTAKKEGITTDDGCREFYVESFTDPVHGGTYDVYRIYCDCGLDEPCTPYTYYDVRLRIVAPGREAIDLLQSNNIEG